MYKEACWRWFSWPFGTPEACGGGGGHLQEANSIGFAGSERGIVKAPIMSRALYARSATVWFWAILPFSYSPFVQNSKKKNTLYRLQILNTHQLHSSGIPFSLKPLTINLSYAILTPPWKAKANNPWIYLSVWPRIWRWQQVTLPFLISAFHHSINS